MRRQLSGISQVEIFVLAPAIVPLLSLVAPFSSMIIWDGLWDFLAGSFVAWVLGIIPALFTGSVSYGVRKILLIYPLVVSRVIWLFVVLGTSFLTHSFFLFYIIDQTKKAREMGAEIGLVSASIACIVIIVLEVRRETKLTAS